MSYVQALVPAEHASNHLLVVPAEIGTEVVRGLAESWFPDVRWLKEPQPDAGPRLPTGARFRGMAAAQTPQQGPGVLGIGGEHGAAGPFPVAADASPQVGLRGTASAYALGRVDGLMDRRVGPPSSFDDRDGIARAFAAGLPEGEELRLVQWGVAAARKVGGAMLADGRQPLLPDPEGAVDLTLYSAQSVPAGEVLGLLRSVIATAEVESTADGSPSFRLVARTPYDGAITVATEQVDRVPRALAQTDPTEYGPSVYRVVWVPQDPYELRLDRPSGVHVIARSRMRALVARLALLLHTRIGGTVVDDGAFVATTAELDRRTDERRTVSRAWI